MKKRCQTTCGNDDACRFINNAGQFECISDMVVNKVWAARKTIELVIAKNQCESSARILDMAAHQMDELIKWVKILQKLQNCKNQGG